jgi:urease accessory protein
LRGATIATSDVFAANRAKGTITLAVGADGGATRRLHLHEAGSLRARFPNCDAGELEAVILNTAGGIAGGDHQTIEIAVAALARLTVTTAAAEKVYRSLGPDATIDVRLTIGAGGRLRWLPQEMILFDRARIRRSIEIDLAENASLVLAEAVFFGRSAMGEAMASGAFFDRWRLRRGGKLILAETVRLDGDIATKLAQTAVADGAQAVATVLVVPGDDSAVAALRGLSEDFLGEVGISCWNGITVVRLCAKDGSHLRRDLASVLSTCGGGSLPRLWLN